MKTLILNQQEVRSLLNMKETIIAVEEAYITFNSDLAVQPPIVSIDVPENNGELDIKACYSKANSAISVKTAVGY